MNPEKILQLVDGIHQEKNIDRELIFEALEIALSKAAGKKLVNIEAEPAVVINRQTGDVTFYDVEVEEVEEEEYNEETGEMEPVLKRIRHIKEDEIIPIDPAALGRVAAQTAKQVIIQRIREAERDAIFDEYATKKGDIMVGTVQRAEPNGNLIVTLDNRTEAFFPRWEQVRDEHYEQGERVKALVLDVKKSGGQKVKIILSRTHPHFVKKLFELEVPEIAEHVIEVKALVREPGYRSKVAVSSIDAKIDAVGACVGVRGSRIKGIIEELNGEKIDIIRWNDSAEVLIQNALKPARIASITLDYDHTKARVVVPDDQLSLAIGKGGQNVRLASRLSGWDIDIMSQLQERELGFRAIAKFMTIPGVDEAMAQNIFGSGYTRFDELLEAGAERLRDTVEGIGAERANEICDWLENVDEDEYYREPEVELPPELIPTSPAEKMARLFGEPGEGDGGAPAPQGGEGPRHPRTATELFRKPAPGQEAPPPEAPAAPPRALDADIVADWIRRLPGEIHRGLDAARKVVAAGQGISPEKWRTIFEARASRDDDYQLFLTQFEDGDQDYADGFAGTTGNYLSAKKPDAATTREFLAALAEYPAITLALASTIPALHMPGEQPLFDWTVAAMLMCKQDAEGNPNPFYTELPASQAAAEKVDAWPLQPLKLPDLGKWMRNVAHFERVATIVRALANKADASALDTSLGLWSFGLRCLEADTANGTWRFIAPLDQPAAELLGYDPDFALFLEEQSAAEAEG